MRHQAQDQVSHLARMTRMAHGELIDEFPASMLLALSSSNVLVATNTLVGCILAAEEEQV